MPAVFKILVARLAKMTASFVQLERDGLMAHASMSAQRVTVSTLL